MSSSHVLPKELLELQLGQIELLLAMYAADDAVRLADGAEALLDDLRAWCSGETEVLGFEIPRGVSLILLLRDLVDGSDGLDNTSQGSGRVLELDISVPLVYEARDGDDDRAVGSTEDAPPVKVRIRQPDWLSKAEAARLQSEVPDSTDAFEAIEAAQAAARDYLARVQSSATTNACKVIQMADEPTARVWFYFPSISTRAKRDDIVDHAPRYGLTGFLLAGKPGVLCLEGGSRAVDEYMRYIKTESWGDIPAHQKKVSERYRETGVERRFEDMTEITDILGERRGERANRGDMKALESWLGDKGLGEAFARVLI
ncbi:hypothetical protein F5Y15DRAFT_72027 [Xylariaceae sp. FL0016]|nr:hypothetical protein F5Y15DRAFT_72027 [Xylariaceae sp. FL0016]